MCFDFVWQVQHFCVLGAALAVLSFVFAWQVQQLMLCKGPDVWPGVFSRPLGSGAFCFDFVWQARHKVFCFALYVLDHDSLTHLLTTDSSSLTLTHTHTHSHTHSLMTSVLGFCVVRPGS